MSVSNSSDEFDISTVVSGVAAALGRVMPEGISSITYTAGSEIFGQGDSGDCAYLIERGTVQVRQGGAGGQRTVARLGPGELFGELALAKDYSRTATLVALDETEVIPVTRDQFEQALGTADPLVRLVLRVALHRLHLLLTEADTPVESTTHTELEPEVQQDLHDTVQSRAISHIRLVRKLREGIRRNQFELHYQPIIAIEDGALAGFEALVRWMHPEDGVIAPAEFIWAAEQTGLIVPLGSWIVEHASHFLAKFLQIRDRQLPDAPPVFMSVNLSPRQLVDAQSADQLIAIIRETGVNAELLKMEITEGLLIGREDVAGVCLRKLKQCGVRLAIDDFGTGFSSLSYLTRFPVDTLKIDQSFVADIDNEGSRQIARTIIALAGSLDMDVIAEGVETRSQLHQLRELGCDYAQGHLFDTALVHDEALALARKRGY
ncbi:MAG: EAL domain-containing protein [Gammaproteobacteria bacterium]